MKVSHYAFLLFFLSIILMSMFIPRSAYAFGSAYPNCEENVVSGPNTAVDNQGVSNTGRLGMAFLGYSAPACEPTLDYITFQWGGNQLITCTASDSFGGCSPLTIPTVWCTNPGQSNDTITETGYARSDSRGVFKQGDQITTTATITNKLISHLVLQDITQGKTYTYTTYFSGQSNVLDVADNACVPPTPTPTPTATPVPTNTPIPTPTPTPVGNISNLNFQLKKTPSLPWWQALGLDVRYSGSTTYINSIPATPTCGAYGLLPSGVTTNTPGILYTGDTDPQLGFGTASSKSWIVGGSTPQKSEVFNAPNSSTATTSFAAITDRLQRSGVTPISGNTLPTCVDNNNCTFPANAPSGVYLIDGTNNSGLVVFTGYTFPVNSNYIILVKGKLDITGAITVPTSTSVLFTSSGDMVVDKVVGATIGSGNCNIPSSQIQGFYSTDTNFIVQGSNTCPTTPDKILGLEGAVVVNASKTTGTFQQQRDLCNGNSTTPVFTIRERPDLILNAPDLLKLTNYLYTEVAP